MIGKYIGCSNPSCGQATASQVIQWKKDRLPA